MHPRLRIITCRLCLSCWVLACLPLQVGTKWEAGPVGACGSECVASCRCVHLGCLVVHWQVLTVTGLAIMRSVHVAMRLLVAALCWHCLCVVLHRQTRRLGMTSSLQRKHCRRYVCLHPHAPCGVCWGTELLAHDAKLQLPDHATHHKITVCKPNQQEAQRSPTYSPQFATHLAMLFCACAAAHACIGSFSCAGSGCTLGTGWMSLW